MIHPDLQNALKSLGAAIPADATPSQAWRMLNPERKTFSQRTFWAVLGRTLPFAHSIEKQKRIATWIYEQKRFSIKGQDCWPPAQVTTKPRFVPVPNPL